MKSTFNVQFSGNTVEYKEVVATAPRCSARGG